MEGVHPAYPHREIGEVLGISENAVAIRMHRARTLLRGLLETP